MSDPFYRLLSVNYQMKPPNQPDQVLYLTGTNAEAFNDPAVAYGFQFALGHLPLLPKWWISWVSAFIDTVDNLVETEALFPYKFEIEVIEYDKARLDSWDDGVYRAKFGNLSVLHSGAFCEHYSVQHLKQTWYRDDLRTLLFLGRDQDDSVGENYMGAVTDHVIDERKGTHIAHRLVKSVKLKVSIWWIYRVSVYDIVPTAPI